MRGVIKWIGVGVLLVALVIGAAAIWKRQELTRLLTVNSLFAPDRIVVNFSTMDELFLWVPLTDDPGRPLPDGPPLDLPPAVRDWIDSTRVTGLLILHDGAVVHESYHQGTGPDDLRISWSLAKSTLSLLTGILIDEGMLALTDPVTLHVPRLVGTAYEDATVEDVLQMESGVLFDENYADPDSDINRMGRILALGGTLDGFTAARDTNWASPGEAMRYVSVDTHVLGMVLRGATGRTIPDLITEKLLTPLGIGRSLFLVDEAGTAFVMGGLNMRTRDYAKIGQLVLDGGRVGDRQVVSEAWIDASTVPSATTAPEQRRYGYHWWMPVDAQPGEVMAEGIYGQYIYIDRTRDVVIAVNAADPAFRDPAVKDAKVALFREIAAATDR